MHPPILKEHLKQNRKQHQNGDDNSNTEEPEAIATAETKEIVRDGILFDCEFFTITQDQIEEWKVAYPRIAQTTKFLPHIQQVRDILSEKKERGELIHSGLAFLHSHLRRENQKPAQEIRQGVKPAAWSHYEREETLAVHRNERTGKVMSLADLLAIIPAEKMVQQ